MKNYLTIVLSFVLLVNFGCNNANSTPASASKKQVKTPNEPYAPKMVDDVKTVDPVLAEERIKMVDPIIQSWVNAAESVAISAGDPNALFAVQVMKNRCHAIPIVYKGNPTSQIISAPKDQKHSGVCFQVILADDMEKFPEWKSFSDKQFLAMYDRQLIMIDHEKTRGIYNQKLKGLVLLHEMYHWKQDVLDQTLYGQTDPMVEVAAYEFEFEIMDKLKLPKYEQFLTQEISKPVMNVNPYIGYSDLAVMFGPLTKAESDVAATLLYLRVAFKQYELDPKTELQRKMNFIGSVYGV